VPAPGKTCKARCVACGRSDGAVDSPGGACITSALGKEQKTEGGLRRHDTNGSLFVTIGPWKTVSVRIGVNRYVSEGNARLRKEAGHCRPSTQDVRGRRRAHRDGTGNDEALRIDGVGCCCSGQWKHENGVLQDTPCPAKLPIREPSKHLGRAL